jgi:hypothetical protein
MNLEQEEVQSESVDLVDQLSNAIEPIEAPVPEEVKGSEQAPVDEPAPPVDETKEELARLQRVIAQNPQLSAVYEAEKYGIQAQPAPQAPAQQPAPVAPPSEPVSLEAIFGDDGFDPYNLNHQYAVQQHAIKAELSPLLEYVQKLQQQEQVIGYQEQAQQVNEAEKHIHTLIDGHLHGFKDFYGNYLNGAKLSPKEEIIAASIETQAAKALGQLPQHLRLNPIAQKEAINSIAPFIKQLASELGYSSAQTQASTQKADAATREIYVEGTGAVVAPSVDGYSKAAKRNDLAGMLDALVQ